MAERERVRVRVGGGLKGCESWEKISVEQPLIKQEAQTIGRMRVCAGDEHDHASGLRHGPSNPVLRGRAGGWLGVGCDAMRLPRPV